MMLRRSWAWWVVGSNLVGFLLVVSMHGPVHAFCGTFHSTKPAFTTRWGSISSSVALRVVNKGMEDGGQGQTFDNQRFELEAMGGDPFFLSDDDDDQQVDTAIVDSTGIHMDLLSEMSMGATGGAMDLLQRAQLGVAPISDRSAAPRNSFRIDEIEAMGGDPFFFMDEDDDDTAAEENADEVEPMAFDVLSEMAMSGGAVMNLLQEASNPLGKMENNRQTKSSDAEKMADKILGMGGDPSFLDDDDVDNKDESDNDAYEQLLAMGGDPFFLLDDDIRDGSTILSTDEEEETNDDDFNPSAMEMLAQVAALSENFDGAGGGGAMKILSEMGSSDSDVDDDDEDSDSEFTLLKELEAMGGDPFFLDDPESDEMVQTSTTTSVDSVDSSGATASEKRRVTDGQGPSPRIAKLEVIEEADWGWDGFVDEDAHYDLD